LSEVPRIGVLNNLRAGKQGSRVDDVLALLRSHPDVAHEETDSAALLPRAIGRLARRDLDVLVVNGGDGTLQHALTEILARRTFSRLPMIAPLRGGRTNMTALDMGAHRNPVKGLQGLLEDARAGRLAARRVERPVLRVGFDRGRRAEYGMFFGVGMIRRAIGLTFDLFPEGRSQADWSRPVTMALLPGRLPSAPGVLAPDKIRSASTASRSAGEFFVDRDDVERLFWDIDPLGPWLRAVPSCMASNARRISRPRRSPVRPGAAFRAPKRNYEPPGRARTCLNNSFTIGGERSSRRPTW
jgi:hypothetical protein